MSPTTLVKPIFVLSPPCAGATVVFDALSRASGIWSSRTETSFIDLDPGADPATHGWSSHRLTAADLSRLQRSPRELLTDTLTDREGRQARTAEGAVRPLATGARLSLRVPLLASAFPDARFVVCFRDPAATISEMLIQWRSGRHVLAEQPPGWRGEPWSLPLVDGWRGLSGAAPADVVVAQWAAITQILLDDLGELDGGRWAVSDFDLLVSEPRDELRRLCGFLEVAYDQALLTPVEGAARLLRTQPPNRSPELVRLLGQTDALRERWRGLLGHRPARAGGSTSADDSPFRSLSTGSFGQALRDLRSSLLITTYQSGKLICARDDEGRLNTHFRDFDKPMGLAVGDGRFALATRTEVWDFRDLPAVAPKLQPEGHHDACFAPRNRHTTGDALIHELAFAGDELWAVATRLSCLVTFDLDNSFVPRWKPRFIDRIAAGDHCHLNGLCVADGRPAYVTALGATNAPGGWRAQKATGGVLIDIQSDEIVVGGLSMPHSPRMHAGRLFVLESGKGQVVTVDLSSGKTEPVVQLPGFTRGFAIHGDYAFVGLSQIRESSTFGDLPITQGLQERVCGVWMIHLRSGQVLGFLRFEDIVQEVFDVSVLTGLRFPEIAETSSTAVSESFVLP